MEVEYERKYVCAKLIGEDDLRLGVAVWQWGDMVLLVGQAGTYECDADTVQVLDTRYLAESTRKFAIELGVPPATDDSPPFPSEVDASSTMVELSKKAPVTRPGYSESTIPGGKDEST